MLFYLIDVTITLALVGIAQKGRIYVSLIPFVWKGLLNDTLSVEGIGGNSEEAIDYSPTCYAHIVAEVAVCLVALPVIETYLSKVARRFS